jgi:hypothetical protein
MKEGNKDNTWRSTRSDKKKLNENKEEENSTTQ